MNNVPSAPTPRPAPQSDSLPPLRFGFSSLGCPELDPAGLRALAAQVGSRYVELRGLNGSLDLVTELARFPGGAPAVRDFFLEAGVRVILVGSSFLLTRSSVALRQALVAEAEAGEALGARWLRVFGGGEWGDPLTAEAAHTARAHRAWWQALRAARGWTIDLILEVHDAFSGSAQVLALLDQTGGPMPLLWDTHHSWHLAGESAAETWQRIGAHVRHVHVKDSLPQPFGKFDHTLVAPGQGNFPLRETLTLLARAAFPGVVSLEWEKYWIPTLPPLVSVLPAWSKLVAEFCSPVTSTGPREPELLLQCRFDDARIVPAAGPYFHGAAEQYEDIEFSGPSSCSRGLGDPTPAFPRLGRFRIYYEGGTARQRFARVVPDEVDPRRRVLRFSLSEPNVTIHWPTGPQHKSRVQTEIYGNTELREFYQTVRLRLLPDAAKVKQYPAKIDWFTLMEFWNHAGWTDERYPFRFGFHLVKPDPAPGTDLFFATAAQHQVDAKTYVDVWHRVNTALPVPFGTWLSVEIYFREGDRDHGRFFAAVTPDGGPRTVLFDVKDTTHHPENPAPTGMKQFSPLKLYTSAELVDFVKAQGSALEVDWADLEIWTGRTPEDVAR